MSKKTEEVSVYMITYNHESNIASAIESVLSQEVDFKFTLYIGEDLSRDDTRKICKSYEDKFPEKVCLLEQRENMGIQKNFLRTMKVCLDSKYVAFTEGDDLWIDTKKLQHQYDFLEQNTSYVAHAHNVLRKDVLSQTEKNFGVKEDKLLSDEELFCKWPFHVISLMARSNSLRDIYEYELPAFISGDRFLNRWLSLKGPVYYEGSRLMAKYHRHDFGASGTSDYHKLAYEEYRMLQFFQNFPIRKPVISRAKMKAISTIVFSCASGKGEKKHSSIKLLIEYARYYFKNSRSDRLYILMLILFGRFFYVMHRSLWERPKRTIKNFIK